VFPQTSFNVLYLKNCGYLAHNSELMAIVYNNVMLDLVTWFTQLRQ